ncbi:MAG: hypothetical protein KDB27_21955 [Planctomycetales bacterium]|nr:hypothetical protein [Planctomycetales bacterium]
MADRQKTFWTIAIVGIGLTLSVGCRLPKRPGGAFATPTPVLLPEQPTFEDVARVVNANSAAVQQLQVSNAKLRSPAIPMSLKARFALEKPRQFRLTAESIRGNELDMGSNEREYWIWMNDERSALFHGRHDQFYQSAARSILPVPPHWLIEAIGLVELDLTGEHDGPTRIAPGQLEIRSIVSTPAGDLEKVSVIDASHGWVLEQRVYDLAADDRLIASASGSDFEYYAATGVSLPRKVEIKLPPANLEFTIEVERHTINQLYADRALLWTLPYDIGDEQVDLEQMSSPAPRYVQPESVNRRSTSDRRFEPTYRRDFGEGYLPPRQAIRRLPPSEDAYRYR